jgi:hypothetical protein
MKLFRKKKINMHKKYFIILIFLLAVMPIVSGCGRNVAEKKTQPIVRKPDISKNEDAATITKLNEKNNSKSTDNNIASSTEIDTSDWQSFDSKKDSGTKLHFILPQKLVAFWKFRWRSILQYPFL